MPYVFDDGIDVSGVGTLAVAGQVVVIAITAVPVGYGGDAVDPTHYHTLGHVAWLVGAHRGQESPIRWADFILGEAPQGVTGLRYELLPGVLATISVGYWVPGTALGSSRLAPAGSSADEAAWWVLG